MRLEVHHNRLVGEARPVKKGSMAVPWHTGKARLEGAVAGRLEKFYHLFYP